jgi:hypothetical protein
MTCRPALLAFSNMSAGRLRSRHRTAAPCSPCARLQACEEAPPEKRKPLFLMWADFEERHGLARHCFTVYDKAAKAVPKNERVEVYRLYGAKAKALVGIPKVRRMLCDLLRAWLGCAAMV